MKIRQDYNIGVNLRKYRLECKLTQEQTVAKSQLLGIYMSRSSYSQLESGLNNIKVSQLLALSEIFNVSILNFFEGLSIH